MNRHHFINKREIRELFVDERDVKFWNREGEKYSYLYWVRAMLNKRDEGWGMRGECNEVGEVASKKEEKASLYSLLAQGLSEPTEDLAKELSTGSFLNPTYHLPLTTYHFRSLRNRDPAELLDSLKTEYTRIFLDSYMPFIPPYESIYLGERRLMGEAASKVVKYYKRLGLGAEGEMPDHIAHECEFMAILYEKNESHLAQEFLKEHLLRWGWKFCEDLLALAKLDFYKGVALIGRELFSWEMSKNEK